MNPRRLFIASCLALITSAFSFQMRQDITDPLAASFSLTYESVGGIMAAAFLGMAIAMLVVAPLCDFLGMGRVLLLAWLCHLSGILGTIFAHDLTSNLSATFVPRFVADDVKLAEWVLWIATFLVGSGNGLVEIAINPLAATVYPKEKTHYLNILHAWWPGGLVISGLLAMYLIGDEGRWGFSAWQLKVGMLLIPLTLYGLLCLGQKFPATERVQANVSTGRMFAEALRPMFLLWAFCMLLTAATELGPNQWQNSVLPRTAGVSGTLVFVYTSALMFVMRFFAGPLAHRFSPIGLMLLSAILSAAGLFWLSYADNRYTAFAAATVFGVGIAYFWPTMLGVAAERFPKGGALLLGLMGCFGNLSIFVVLPQMGAIYDSYTVNAMSPELRAETVTTIEGESLPLVVSGEKSAWVPEKVAERIYPAGAQKPNPKAKKVIADAETIVKSADAPKAKQRQPSAEEVEHARKVLSEVDVNAVGEAEKVGASWAFRWVVALPCVLIIIFALIALTDKLRGGYRQEHLTVHDAPRPIEPPPGT